VFATEAHRLERIRADAQVFLDETVDLRRWRQDRVYLQPRGQAQLVEAPCVVRNASSNDAPPATASRTCAAPSASSRPSSTSLARMSFTGCDNPLRRLEHG